MPYFDPKFPIVDPDPSVDRCIKSFRTGHYFYVGGVTSGSWVYGFVFGRPARFPTAAMAATMGFSFACISILCDSRDRLLGFKENTKEVKQWGLSPLQPTRNPVDYRFPVASSHDSPLRPKVDWDDYK